MTRWLPLCSVFLALAVGSPPAGSGTEGSRRSVAGPFSFEASPGSASGNLRVRVVRAPGAQGVFDDDVSTGVEEEELRSWLRRPGAIRQAVAVADSDAVVVDDYNFDGWPDFSVLASVGNVQINRHVYLYDPAASTFKLHEALGEVACLRVDRSRKRLVGACFHSSAANNWTTEYAFVAGRLRPLVRKGTDYRSQGERTLLFTFRSTYSGSDESVTVLSCVEETTSSSGAVVRRKLVTSACAQ
ncbi:hypothetical protein HLB44_14265 [Aquincola sp. S2]|uniref:VCBS repeat-containing protein n=1 Tax=Pseudaquabacterium terrae TaxID=2732868 RepID=A0ABX2EHU7_9BURK|nr:hypothetical protein [Aquabacterium terrae]NRF68154.1 hypothetical protein [Aquabacterium terrae]